jgi:hypothetical protein
MNKALTLKVPGRFITIVLIICVFWIENGKSGEKEHLDYAYRLVEKTEMSKMFIDLVEASLQPYFDRYEEPNPENDTIVDPFRKIFIEEVNASEEELKWNLAEIYTKYFSEAELRGIIRFFYSPAGQTWLDKKSMVLHDGDQIGQEWGQILTHRIMKKFESAYGEKF